MSSFQSSSAMKRNISATSFNRDGPPTKHGRVHSGRGDQNDAMFDHDDYDENFLTGHPHLSFKTVDVGIEESAAPAHLQTSLFLLDENVSTSPSRKQRRRQKKLSGKVLGRKDDKTPQNRDDNDAKVDQAFTDTDIRDAFVDNPEETVITTHQLWRRVKVDDTLKTVCSSRALAEHDASPVSVCLHEVHLVGAYYQHITPSLPNHPFFRNLSDPVAEFLLDVAAGDYSQAVQDAVHNGTLIASRPEDVSEDGQAAYLRNPTPKTQSAECMPATCLRRYVTAYPTDLGWALVGEMNLQPDVLALLVKVMRSLEPPLVQVKGHSFYTGITNVQTADERLEQDMGKGRTRFSNYMKANEPFLNLTAYNIPGCAVPSSTGLHTDRHAGDMEVFLIHMSCGMGLNHAVGGYIPYFEFPPSFSTIVSIPLPPRVFGTHTSPTITDCVTKFLEEQRTYLSSRVSSPKATNSAFRTIIKNGLNVFHSLDSGIVPGIRLLDIISLEALLGEHSEERVGGLWDQNSG
ncbi:hypothetical protein K438DRAFT_1959850 [Mycena galopus ATCC 62051]|nr:hypothetical protein K438DRAFT_1959850 [Mycena galopus ATCC 62051]